MSLNDLRSGGGLKFLHLNIRSLLPKLDFITTLISESAPDVIVITESWLTGKVPDSDVAISGFNLFRADRISKGGGVIVYVKEHLATHIILSTSVPKLFECIVLDVCVGGTIHIIISGVYFPPTAPNSALEKLCKILSNYTTSELTILGDLNLNWLSPCSSKLKELCLELICPSRSSIPRDQTTKMSPSLL